MGIEIVAKRERKNSTSYAVYKDGKPGVAWDREFDIEASEKAGEPTFREVSLEDTFCPSEPDKWGTPPTFKADGNEGLVDYVLTEEGAWVLVE